MATDPRRERADVIVVGGGSAGSVVAARLSEDPARRVVLLEEGPDPQPIPEIIADPKRQGELILESEYVRLYDADRADGSTFPLISGKVLGGGSSVNNLGVMRPLRRDFDAWERFGGEAWSYDAMLPLARALEEFYALPFERLARYAPAGTPAEVAAALAPYREAGCTNLNLIPIAADPEQAIDAVAEVRSRLVG